MPTAPEALGSGRHMCFILFYKRSHIVESLCLVQGDINDLSDQRCVSSEMYDCVVGKSSCHKAGLVGIDLLHKDFLYRSLMALYDLCRNVLDFL